MVQKATAHITSRDPEYLAGGLNIALAGGTAQVPGLRERLETETERLMSETKVCVLPVVAEAGWSGGSLMAAVDVSWDQPGVQQATWEGKWGADAVVKPPNERGYQPTWSVEVGK